MNKNWAFILVSIRQECTVLPRAQFTIIENTRMDSDEDSDEINRFF